MDALCGIAAICIGLYYINVISKYINSTKEKIVGNKVDKKTKNRIILGMITFIIGYFILAGGLVYFIVFLLRIGKVTGDTYGVFAFIFAFGTILIMVGKSYITPKEYRVEKRKIF